ncbi:MAG: LysR family transcriptional regulator [Oscillospiraceae bacterium]|nr:LysR family transcriptional regulator [Oscillospiraceae bacterium]
MEIRNLNTFLRVAALCNFTQAAKELGYSQSNVSAQIQQLEQELGAPLFNRAGRHVTLTQFGEALLPYAHRLSAAAAELENLTKSPDFLSGTVRIGMTDSLSELLLEEAFIAYHRRFPRVRLDISLATTSSLLERLRQGQLDAACVITNPLSHFEWQIRDEIDVPIVVAANPALPIAGKKSVSLQELTQQELVMMETLAPYSLEFERMLAQHHLVCEPVFRLQSADTARRLVERAPFVSVLPLYTVKASAEAGTLCILNVPHWEHRQRIQTVLHRSKVATPQIEGFLQELQRILTQILAERL